MLFNVDDILVPLTAFIHDSLGSENILLMRTSPLEGIKAGKNPRFFVLVADVDAGATSIDLQLADGSGLKGALLAASRLKIAGVEYSVQADVQIPSPSAAVITGVTIVQADVSPAAGLAAAALAGAQVELLSGPQFTFEHAHVMKAGRRDSGADVGAELYFTVSLPIEGAPTVPKVGDSIRRVKDGTTGAIARMPVMIGGAWDCEIGPP